MANRKVNIQLGSPYLIGGTVLRKWTPAQLRKRENWDFSEFVRWERDCVETACKTAFFWELEREIFHPHNKPPFIREWRKRGSIHPSTKTPWIHGHPLWRVLEMEKPLDVFPSEWGEPVVINLPRSATHEELLTTFKVFLTKWRPDHKGGAKKKVSGWFRDLAVYRARMAGLSMKEGVELMGAFLNSDQFPRMTAPEWNRGEARTRERLALFHDSFDTLAARLVS